MHILDAVKSGSQPPPRKPKPPPRAFMIAFYGGIGSMLLLCGGCLFMFINAGPTAEQIAIADAQRARAAEQLQTRQAEQDKIREAEAAERKAKPRLTLERYNECQPGFPMDLVVSLIGQPSEQLSASEIGGVRTEVYRWNNLFSSATLTFQDGVLVARSQRGL